MDLRNILSKLDQIAETRVEEDDVEEGNKFSGELERARAAGEEEFEVDGKKYKVNEADLTGTWSAGMKDPRTGQPIAPPSPPERASTAGTFTAGPLKGLTPEEALRHPLYRTDPKIKAEVDKVIAILQGKPIAQPTTPAQPGVLKQGTFESEEPDNADDVDGEEDAEDDDDDKPVNESQLQEKAAPGQEDWIKSNKQRFIKQYGKDKGMEVLYATAQKRSKKNESLEHIEECYDMAMKQPEQESGMSINASTDTRSGNKSLTVTAQGEAAEQLAQLLKLSGLSSGHSQQDMEMEEAAYVNTPEPETQGVEVQLAQGNDLNRAKNSYPKVAGGDNPMAMREAQELAEIEQRLNEELAAFKVVAEGKGKKPDFLDMDKDGDKKEPMKKALADKAKKSPPKAK
jgi:hypothetical protein